METFLIRVWVPPAAEAGAAAPLLRGVVEKVGSRHATPFSSADELILRLSEALAARHTDEVQPEETAAPPLRSADRKAPS